MRSVLLRNLRLTIPTILGFTALGYGFSFPLGFVFDADALNFKLGQNIPSAIETQRLIDLNQFQARVTAGGAILGAVIAQTTFIVSAISQTQD